ncbi:MAG TPA: PAS domain S-box protein, partial [Geobacteraceae bacterium]
DLEGKRVAIVRDDIHQRAFRDAFAKFGKTATFVEVDKYRDVFRALVAGEADAGIVSHIFALKNAGEYNVHPTSVVFNPIELRFAVLKGKHRPVLEALDRNLAHLKEDRNSVYHTSFARWFGGAGKEILPAWVRGVLVTVGAIVAIFVVLTVVLRRQVRVRTRHLEREIAERKFAQKALGESEERFRTLIEKAPVAIGISRLGRTIYTNGKYLELFGFDSAQELVGRSLGEQWATEHREETVERPPGHPVLTEYEGMAQRKDGAPVSVHVAATLVELSDGPATIGFITDITERKMAEDAMRASESRFRTLSEQMPDFVWQKDRDGVYVFCNRRYADVLGLTPETIAGHRDDDFYPPELAAKYRGDDERVVATGEPLETEESWRLAGKERWLHTSKVALLDKSGRCVGTIAIARDITEQRCFQDVLRKSEEKFAKAFNTIPTILTISTLDDGMFIDVNATFLQKFGYRREEVLGHTSVELEIRQNPQDRAEVLNLLGKYGSIHDVEFTFRKRNGEALIGLFSGETIEINGEMCLISMVNDITERRRTEEELRQSERKFGTIFRASPVPLAVSEYATGRFLEVNEALLRLMRASSLVQMIGRTSMEIGMVTPGERQKILLATEGKSWVERLRINMHRLDGEPFLSELSLSTYEFKGIRYLLTSIVDVTERERAEHELRLAEERYRGIFENAVEGIFQSTPEGRLISVNPAIAQMLGYASPEDTIASVTDIQKQLYVVPDDRIAFKRRMEVDGEVRGFETRLRRRDGSPICVSLNARAIHDAEGRVERYEGTIENISELSNIKSQLHQVQKLEAVGTLAGGVAHDFNNILTAIIGFGSILEMKMNRDDPLFINVTQILAAADRAANLTRSLLAFSRKQPIEPRAANLNVIVTGLEKMLQRLIREDIELEMDLAKTELTVLADTGQIEQVFLNLTTNARDAMPDGGRITITTDMVTLDEEFRKVHGFGDSGRFALVIFSDTGQGMTEDVRQRIFEPFFTSKEPGKGTGLGLAVCYGIIKQHKGYITCYSEPGLGTTFRMYLPVAAGASEDVTEAAVAPLPTGTETILVAEDDPVVRELTTTILAEYGYTVIQAADGEEAVARVAQHGDRIDLCLFDIIMPKKKGWEAYEEVRATRPDVRALFMSGHQPDISFPERLAKEGVLFITKPVVPKELLKKVREALEK